MSSDFAFGGPKPPLGAVRAVGAVTQRLGGPPDRTVKSAEQRPVAQRSDALDPGQPPIDADRVQEVRRAIERGDYPIVPAKVADAIIAAGILLRSGK